MEIERRVLWESDESDESIKSPSTSNNNLNPEINLSDNAKTQLKFDGSCLKQDKFTFNHNGVVNIYIVYEINLWPIKWNSSFMLKILCLGLLK